MTNVYRAGSIKYLIPVCIMLFLYKGLYAQEKNLVIPVGHNNRITDFTLSQDGTLLASSDISKIKIWEQQSGFELLTLTGHQWAISSLAISPGNDLLASADYSGNFILWSLKTRQQLKNYGFGNTLYNIRFSPDGSQVGFLTKDSSLYIYSIAGDSMIIDIKDETPFIKFEFFHKSPKLAVLYEENGTTSFYSFDIKKNEWDQNVEPFSYKHGKIIDFSLSLDDKLLYSIVDTDSGQIRVHELNKSDIARFNGHRLKPTHIISSDSAHIIYTQAARGENHGETYTSEREIKRWDIRKGICTDSVYLKNNENISAIIPVPRTSSIITGNMFIRLAAYNLASGQKTIEYRGYTSALTDIYPNSKTRFLSNNNFGYFFSYDLMSKDVAQVIHKDIPDGVIYSTTSTRPGNYIFRNQAALNYLKQISLTDLRVDTLLQTNHYIKNPPARNGSHVMLLTGKTGKNEIQQLQIFDIVSGKIIAQYTDSLNELEPYLIKFAPGKEIALIAHVNSNCFFIWDYIRQSMKKVCGPVPSTIRDFIFLNDSTIVSAHLSGFYLWNYTNGRLLQHIRNDSGYEKLLNSDSESFFWATDVDGNVKKANARNFETITVFNTKSALTHWGYADKNTLYTYLEGEAIQLWDVHSGKQQYSFIPVNETDYVIVDPQGYYKSTPGAAKLLHYTTPDLKVISFEQMDVKYNRPDLLLKAMGSTDSLLIRSYKYAYDKRMRKLGIDTTAFLDGHTVPVADFENRQQIKYEQSQSLLSLRIKGSDNLYKLERFNLWVNGSPLFGQRGLSLSKRKINAIDTTITIRLSKGTNRIETSVSNSNGTESFRIPLLVSYAGINDPSEKAYFIGIGIDQFKENKHNLQYSVKDIRDLAGSLKKRYGSTISIDTLFNKKVSTANIKKLRKKLLETGVNDKVIIAYSGHGLLNKNFDYFLSTYEVNFASPEVKGLPYDELESLIDSIPARKKLVLIDACHSGELDKEEMMRIDSLVSNNTVKGVKPITYKKDSKLGLQNSFELMQSLFVNVGKNTGATIIAAAAGTQFALERGDLKNGIFSFSILEILNSRPTVKLSELRSAVEKRVTSLTGNIQKPTSRAENRVADWDL